MKDLWYVSKYDAHKITADCLTSLRCSDVELFHSEKSGHLSVNAVRCALHKTLGANKYLLISILKLYTDIKQNLRGLFDTI